jgi:hypothetical protein
VNATEQLLLATKALGCEGPVREFRFGEGAGRRWRADLAWLFPAARLKPLLVEIDGATWTAGRHTRGAGYAADCEKQACATLMGYAYLRVTTEQVQSGQAAQWIAAFLHATPPTSKLFPKPGRKNGLPARVRAAAARAKA